MDKFALSGKIDKRISSWLSEALVTAHYKKQQGGDVRPKAVEEVFRRLIGCVCCVAVKRNLRDLFLPHGKLALVFMVVSTLEAEVHYPTSYIVTYGHDPTLCCLKLDISKDLATATVLHF